VLLRPQARPDNRGAGSGALPPPPHLRHLLAPVSSSSRNAAPPALRCGERQRRAGAVAAGEAGSARWCVSERSDASADALYRRICAKSKTSVEQSSNAACGMRDANTDTQMNAVCMLLRCSVHVCDAPSRVTQTRERPSRPPVGLYPDV
jgi:hypothetical protein